MSSDIDDPLDLADAPLSPEAASIAAAAYARISQWIDTSLDVVRENAQKSMDEAGKNAQVQVYAVLDKAFAQLNGDLDGRLRALITSNVDGQMLPLASAIAAMKSFIADRDARLREQGQFIGGIIGEVGKNALKSFS